MPNGDATIYCHRFCAKCFIIIVNPQNLCGWFIIQILQIEG